jgi:hypothetical protein
MRRHKFSLLRLVLWLALIYVIFDGIFIRSGLYYRFVEPESTVGSILLYRKVIERRLDPAKSNILVLGDSRVAEGFSAKTANALNPDIHTNYIGCGISGSTPRIWRYFLRWIDPHRTKFSAIVLMTSAFSDDEIYEDLGNRALDLNYSVPLLYPSDLGQFPATFASEQLQDQAKWAVLTPLVFLQSDVKAFISHPVVRTRKAILWRNGYPDWIYEYPGRTEALPNLKFFRGPIRPQSWDGISAPLKSQLEGYFAQLSGSFQALPAGKAGEYRRRWYGGIASDYAAAGVPIYIFLMPRGPYHAELMGLTTLSGSFAQFAGTHAPHLLDPKPFCQLEIPANFFDQFHLNAVGRERLTRCLVQELSKAR